MAACYANPSLALKELGWTAVLGLDRMCEFLPRPLTLGAGLTPGRESGAGHGLPGSEQAHPGLPKMGGSCIPVWTLTPPPPITGEDLWRWQKQNPSGFGAQA